MSCEHGDFEGKEGEGEGEGEGERERERERSVDYVCTTKIVTKLPD